MFVQVSPKAAQKISRDGNASAAETLVRNFSTASIDVGVCAIHRIPLRDGNFLYIDSYEWGAGIANSATDWVNSEWSDPASEFAIPADF